MPKRQTRKVIRSAITGHFVNKGYAKGHPKTTVSEHVRKGRRK